MITKINTCFNKHHKWLIPFLFFTMSILGILYLLSFQTVYFNSDFVFHLNRIHSIVNSLKNGQFPLISQGANVPYGVTLSYYPWLTLLPFSFLSIFIHSTVNLFYTIIAIVNFTTLMVSYYSYLKISSKKLNAFIFAILYANGSIIFNWAFRSGDIGAILATAFLPMSFLAIVSFIEHKGNHYLMLTVGVILAISSHVITGGLVILTLIILTVANLFKFKPFVIVKLLLCAFVVLMATSIFWYPILKLSANNPIVMPAVFNSVSSGIINYIGQSTNYIYDLPCLIGLLAIINFKSPKFKLIDLEIWGLGLMYILVNSYFIADPLAKVFPIILKLQFTYRFGLLAHLLLSFLATRLLTGYYRNMKWQNTFLTLTSMIMLITPITNQITFQFLLKSRTLIKSTEQLNRLNNELVRGKLKNGRTPFKFNDHSYYVLNHYFYNNDYDPSRKVGFNESFDREYLTGTFTKSNHWQTTIPFKAENDGIVINNNDNYVNIEYPIVIYRGIKYTFNLNGKEMSDKYINHKLTSESYRLTLNNLPNGENKVSIKSAHLE